MKAITIRLSDDAEKIVNANKGRKSISETVNMLIVRSAEIDTGDDTARALELIERLCAAFNAVHSEALADPEVQSDREDILEEIRNGR